MDIRTYLSQIGRRGGKSTSARKRKASAENLVAARAKLARKRAKRKSKKDLDI